MSEQSQNHDLIAEFKEALRVLNIEDYAERIFHSNSHGELFHLEQYSAIARAAKDDPEWFRPWFEIIVEEAEQTWERPESVFQHITEIIMQLRRSMP